MRNVRRSLLRSRRDKADDEDLSRNVGGQERCELERQARIDRLKDRLGQRLSARAIHRLHIVDPRLAEDRTVAPKAQLDGDLVALMRRSPTGRDGRSDFRRKIDRAAPTLVGRYDDLVRIVGIDQHRSCLSADADEGREHGDHEHSRGIPAGCELQL